ncbi:MAG TPA: nucleotidyltransferase family protein [Nitrospirales bacterium]|nr:nucleotidyltransferase family protein [Nitrospira sp. MA-1]HNP61303.1 nucleotidyltransferase family protein [Nitrospirales bacterium]
MVQIGIRKAIVLAGGRGERLQSVVPDLPKPMAPVGGRPFLEYILDKIVDAGVTDVIISVGYKAEVIQEHFGRAYRSLQIRYSRESYPLGTGGAMALALKGEDSSPALVFNGDTLVDIDYSALMVWYEQTIAQVAIVLRQVPDVSRFGSVILLGERVVEFQEKGQQGPGLVNAGVYVVRPEIFSQYEFGSGEHFSFETDILQAYCRELQPRAFLTKGYFIDIGTPGDYERAQKEAVFSRFN